MTGLEIVGAIALYILGVGSFGYLVMAFLALATAKRGLESIPMIIIPPIIIWVVGAMIGLVLLGRML